MATKLIVTGLSDEFTEACLYDLFDMYGAIADIELAIDPHEGGRLGHGFVVFERDVDAARARLSMDGAEICGRILRVRDASDASAVMVLLQEPRTVWGGEAYH